jgi:chitinase
MKSLAFHFGLMFLALTLCVCYHAGAEPSKLFVAYYESWANDYRGGLDRTIVDLPPAVTILNLAFMRPDAVYTGGSFDLSGTGLDLPYSGAVLKDSVSELKRRHPRTKVLISVGGAAHGRWHELHALDIARFISEFGFDGVDIDFEPPTTACRRALGQVTCESDADLVRALEAIRAAIPAPMTLSLTADATAAFGEGPWSSALPEGGPSYGMALKLLRDSDRLHSIDIINIMAYDCGPELDPVIAYKAFRHYFKGQLTIGFTPPPEAWGNHAYTESEIEQILNETLRIGANGAMLFGLKKDARRESTQRFENIIAKALARPRP